MFSDYYLLANDFVSYLEAQERVDIAYRNQPACKRRDTLRHRSRQVSDANDATHGNCRDEEVNYERGRLRSVFIRPHNCRSE